MVRYKRYWIFFPHFWTDRPERGCFLFKGVNCTNLLKITIIFVVLFQKTRIKSKCYFMLYFKNFSDFFRFRTSIILTFINGLNKFNNQSKPVGSSVSCFLLFIYFFNSSVIVAISSAIFFLSLTHFFSLNLFA